MRPHPLDSTIVVLLVSKPTLINPPKPLETATRAAPNLFSAPKPTGILTPRSSQLSTQFLPLQPDLPTSS